MDLVSLSKGYLEAEGFEVSRRGSDLLIGNRLAVGEEREFVYVWVLGVSEPEAIRSREGAYLARFKEAADSHPAAQRILLVDSRVGLSREFEAGAHRWYDVKVRTPAQFFDTAFKWEGAPETASALLRLKERGDAARRWRVPQPFRLADGEEGQDLLPRLRDGIMTPVDEGKPISLVIGPAGMGKTVLLATLFAQLYEDFQDRKRQQVLAPRPLVLLPEHVPLGDVPTVRSILRGFLSAEFARPLGQGVFEWRLTHGLACWLLDGLDEIISLDPGFFDDLLDLLTRPGPGARVGPMRIVVSVRDALLATNEAIREFLDVAGDLVEVYELAPWSSDGKRRFAESELGNRADNLLKWVSATAAANRLSGIPYYYKLIVDAFRTGTLSGDIDEVTLLSMAFRSILQRDVEKGIVNLSVTPEEDVVEFAESIAVEDMRNGFRGVSIDVARDWARLILPPDLPEGAADRWLASLTQLALFSRGGLGQIQFTQELIEQYLLGQALVRALENRRETFLQLLSLRQLPRDWLAMRILADHVAARQIRGDLVTTAAEHVSRGVLFKNLVQLVLLAGANPQELRVLPLEQRDLSGVCFPRVDMSEISFRGCNLTDSVFEAANLRGASFAGAILGNTTFEGLEPDALVETDFGDLSRCHSVRVDGRLLVGAGEVRTWLDEMRAAQRMAGEPCPTALQLRHLFAKFVRPDGSPRRSWLDRRGLQRGRRFAGSADMDDLIDAATRHGYLVPKAERDLVERASGDHYAELVEYVRDLALSEGLRTLLDDACPAPGCSHVG
jgi:hypothetical protein